MFHQVNMDPEMARFFSDGKNIIAILPMLISWYHLTERVIGLLIFCGMSNTNYLIDLIEALISSADLQFTCINTKQPTRLSRQNASQQKYTTTAAYLHRLLRDPGVIEVSSAILMNCYMASDQYVITLNLARHNLDPQAV